jgi:hypothetical protein
MTPDSPDITPLGIEPCRVSSAALPSSVMPPAGMLPAPIAPDGMEAPSPDPVMVPDGIADGLDPSFSRFLVMLKPSW